MTTSLLILLALFQNAGKLHYFALLSNFPLNCNATKSHYNQYKIQNTKQPLRRVLQPRAHKNLRRLDRSEWRRSPGGRPGRRACRQGGKDTDPAGRIASRQDRQALLQQAPSNDWNPCDAVRVAVRSNAGHGWIRCDRH